MEKCLFRILISIAALAGLLNTSQSSYATKRKPTEEDSSSITSSTKLKKLKKDLKNRQAQEEGQTPFNIDEELIIHIFSFLSPEERANSSLVCHQWNNLRQNYFFDFDQFLKGNYEDEIVTSIAYRPNFFLQPHVFESIVNSPLAFTFLFQN